MAACIPQALRMRLGRPIQASSAMIRMFQPRLLAQQQQFLFSRCAAATTTTAAANPSRSILFRQHIMGGEMTRHMSTSSSSSSSDEGESSTSEEVEGVEAIDDEAESSSAAAVAMEESQPPPTSKKSKGRTERRLPRRFLDAMHLHRVNAVKELVDYRKTQWEERKENLTYDIKEMDLAVTNLQSEEDNAMANKIIEDVRDVVHRSGTWPMKSKKEYLLHLKEILEDTDMWYNENYIDKAREAMRKKEK
mmetsp:Transcript_2256/g.3597  ORF Transcript_2256/g.3597 Transcript_2256/m.3597 type:complete len:249 (-) Transcript_2256:97-843(-)